MDQAKLLNNAQILLSRLERLSADSVWAHKASGLRGSLIRCLEGGDASKLKVLVEQGYELLTNAAREIPDHTDV